MRQTEVFSLLKSQVPEALDNTNKIFIGVWVIPFDLKP